MDEPRDMTTQGDPDDSLPSGVSSEAGPPGSSDWEALVAQIREGGQAGMEALYATFSRGIRFYLSRQLGPQELEDKMHDTFLIVVQAIQKGELREPSRLMGFVRTIVRRQVASYIGKLVSNRRDQVEIETGVRIADLRRNPEELAIDDQRVEIMRQLLRGISNRDREILTRFYLDGQSQEQICSEMGLTSTQFRLLKSRAKARFGELGRRRFGPHEPEGKKLRKSVGR
jgi:RNA polymerase sigma factor (sigma-70 family)